MIAFHMSKQGLWTYSVTSADQPTHRFQFCAAEKSSFLTCTIALADLAPSRCQVTRPDGHVQPFPTVDIDRGDGLPYLTMGPTNSGPYRKRIHDNNSQHFNLCLVVVTGCNFTCEGAIVSCFTQSGLYQKRGVYSICCYWSNNSRRG